MIPFGIINNLSTLQQDLSILKSYIESKISVPIASFEIVEGSMSLTFEQATDLLSRDMELLKDKVTAMGYTIDEDSDWLPMGNFQRTIYMYFIQKAPSPL